MRNPTSIWRRSAAATALALLGTCALAPTAWAGRIISNGRVALGVNDLGHLIYRDVTRQVGLTFEPVGQDGLRRYCECEGWGVGVMDGAASFSGSAENAWTGAAGSNLDLQSFSSTATTARSVVSVDGKLRVTHEFAPSPKTPDLFAVKVTLSNVGATTLPEVRYRRVVDFNPDPNGVTVLVTIQRGNTPAPAGNLVYSTFNGQENPDPLVTPRPLGFENRDFAHLYGDLGTLFDFSFGTLAPGASKSFTLYYGVSTSEDAAMNAVALAGLALYAFGQPDLPPAGLDNTFIFGFSPIAGAPPAPPALALTPKTSSGPVGTSHTVTAQVTSAGGGALPSAPVLLKVAGSNKTSRSASTGGDGTATFSYTGSHTGADTLLACVDTSADGVCDADEPRDTASRTWVPAAPPPADTTRPSCVLSAVGVDGSGRRYSETTIRDLGSGLQAIQVLSSVNATTVVPPFAAGTTGAVAVRSTRIDQAHSSSVALRATDVAGNVVDCDPGEAPFSGVQDGGVASPTSDVQDGSVASPPSGGAGPATAAPVGTTATAGPAGTTTAPARTSAKAASARATAKAKTTAQLARAHRTRKRAARHKARLASRRATARRARGPQAVSRWALALGATARRARGHER